MPLVLASMLGQADVAWRFGSGPENARDALQFLGASEALRGRHGIGWDPCGADDVRHWQSLIRNVIGDEAADHSLAAGLALSIPEAVNLSRNLTISHAAQSVGGDGAAISLFTLLGSIE